MQKVFDETKRVVRVELEAKPQLTTKEVINDNFPKKIEEFILKIKACNNFFNNI